jgi:CRISPR-associated protein Cmr2
MQSAQDLLLFSLGPVQSFISTARRTQDLWLGSQLLSNLALVGVQAVDTYAESSGAKVEVLFPAKRGKKWPKSIPNRFAVSAPRSVATDLGQKIDDAVRAAWQAAAAHVRTEFVEDLAIGAAWRAIWARQVNTWLETYWIAWHQALGKGYGENYRLASQAMGARKALRPIPSHAEPGEKCTLCGEREVLHAHESDDRDKVRGWWDRIASRCDITGAELREGERLCAICTIKRFAARAETEIGGRKLEPEERFPSTSSFASARFRLELLDKWDAGLEAKVQAHVEALQSLGVTRFRHPDALPCLTAQLPDKDQVAKDLLHYDGDFFYRETFTERLEETLGLKPANGEEIPKEKRRQAKQAVKTLRALIEEAQAQEREIDPPHKYYAVIAMDGDHMGALLSQCTGQDQHQAVSQALVEFAEDKVPRIVENEHCGRVVYAGGDDVLALAPVHEVLEVADKLQRAFSETMPGHIAGERTASAGIAISHHTQPLESALRAARQGEHDAKHELGRAALVVQVLRRSGERREVGTKWQVGGNDAMEAVQDTVQAMDQEALSGKVAYDLLDEQVALDGCHMPAVARIAELGRLLSRHWSEKAARKAEQDGKVISRDALEAMLTPLLQAEGDDGWKINEMANWLLLARFLAQGGRQ